MNTCPIPGCTLNATGLGFCKGHFKHVPKPIQSEIYQLCVRHKGGPTHQGAIRRACIAVIAVMDGWKHPKPAPSTPYRDD